MVASQRLVAVLLLTAAVITVPGVAHAASRRTCGFYPANLHRVSQQKNITCAEAKRVLLRLRGRRDTVPMICGKSRVIHGWRLESQSRLWSAVVNRYSRGRQSFVYLREQNAYRIYCPPKGGFTSEGVRAPPSAELPQATGARSRVETAAVSTPAGHGTGVLSKTRFVKAPIIVLFAPSKPDPHDAGYTIYFRLSRDLPRNPAGGRNAVFAPFEDSSDPILGLLARPGRWCFAQDVGTDPTETGLPTKRGSKIHLILKAHDSRHRTGTLPATATLRVQKPRAANDYRPSPYPKELGCPLG